MKTRAAVLHAPGRPFEVRALDLAPPQGGEVLVRIRAVGVCHSDWHLVTGDTPHPMPLVAGHEGAGVVEAVGASVSGVAPGDHVALSWAPSCGTCFYCTRGRPSLCEVFHAKVWSGTLLDGSTRLSLDGQPVYHYCALAAFADYAVVPQSACVVLPASVPFPVAALIGCAVTTGVGATVHSMPVGAVTIAVFGLGGVGLSVVMGARLFDGTRVIAVDTSEEKLALALELGASDGVLAGPDADNEIRRRTAGRGADCVIEAVGLAQVQVQSIAAARPGGTVILSGLAPVGSTTAIDTARLTREEKTIVGSYYGSADPALDFPRIAGWYAEGRLPLDRLIRRTYGLSEINQAYADLVAGAPGRGVVLMDGEA